jgi:hypothetical protein
MTLGLHQNIEYLTSVLPAHALSEIRSDAQLSLAAVAYALGMRDGAAMRLGTVSFFAVTLAAVPLARVLARRFDDAAFVVAVPAALAVLGGVFMHVTELVAAVPLALLLVQRTASRRWPAMLALLLLAVPWWSLATPLLLGSVTGVLLSAVTVFYLVFAFAPSRPLIAAAVAVCAAVTVGLILRWHDVTAVHTALSSVPDGIARSPYPETEWKWFNDTYMATGSAPSWLLRCASWAGLCAVFFSAWSRRDEAAVV